MPSPLSPAQVEAYRRDGFVSPVEALADEEVRAARRALEEFEASLPPGPVGPRDRRKLHVRLPWARRLAEDARILDAVEQLIGPDILVYQSTFFVKEPGSDAVAAWHQDATYFGLQPYRHVSAWLALSEASAVSGCMRFVPGSHFWGQRRHRPEAVAGSVNAGAQTISEEFDTGAAVHAPLRPGQFSLHHTLVVHGSAPNRGGDRRIGFAISYIPVEVKHTGSRRMGAALVRGKDRFGHFEPEPDPRDLGPQERVAAHHRAYARYRAGYQEQMALHAAAA